VTRRRFIAAGLGLGLLVWLFWPYDRSRFDPGPGVILTDRDGRVLRRAGPGAQWVPLERISPALIAATVAAEDHRFYSHHGVDARALARAAWLDLRAHRAAYGGSTISMQLARLLHPAPRGLGRKLMQVRDAIRIERALSKRAILEQYLNRAYYGNRAVGAEAAAQLYFGKPAAMLSLGEASLLAVLPRAPEGYDLYRHLPAARERREHVLALMVAHGFASIEEVRGAAAEPLALQRTEAPLLAPHFTDHVLAELAPDARGTVATTLDLSLQERVERALASHLHALAAAHVSNAGLVILDNDSGAVRALVGSAGYFDREHAGAIDIALRRRSPGSTLKPFVYALAIERGDAPTSIAYDVAFDRPGLRRAHNADGRERGPVRYRDALGSSLNLAALDVVTRRVELSALESRLQLAGILPSADPTHGPSIVLGAAAVRPLDLAAAFAAFGRDGTFHPWNDLPARARPAERLFAPEVAWLVTDMLADPQARRPVFGEDLPLDLPFRVAAKTGTSAGFADNLTVATTREHTVLAWAGNFDGSPMHGVLAMRGAAPLVRAALLTLRERGPLTLPEAPAGLEQAVVCPLSGLRPGPHCPARKRDWFVRGTVPSEQCDWHGIDGRVHLPEALREFAARRVGARFAPEADHAGRL
jgi:penicillin-binding protein 1C